VSDMQVPAGPQNTLAYRGAKYAVIILSALIILALIALVVGVAMKLSGRLSRPSASGQTFVLPRGAKIVTTDVQPGRIVLHVRSPQGDEIDIIETDTGRLVSRIAASPPPAPARQ